MPISTGFSTVDLPTPPDGRLAGYAVDGRIATGTADPLTATIARFQAPPARPLVWVGIDALAIGPDLHDAVQAAIQARLPDADVLVSATHTHSAPGAWCGTIHPLLPATVDRAQIAKVAQRIGDALPTARPVRLLHGTAPAPGVGTNRDDPALPIDTSVGVLAAITGGYTIGLVVDHACHPTVLGPANTLYSPDWVAGLRAGVAQALPDTPVLFLQGAAGDVSTRFTRRAPTTDETHRIGRLVAASALRALEYAHPLDPASTIRLTRHTLTLHRRDAAAELRALHATPGTAGLDGLQVMAAHPGPKTLTVPIADLSIGAARFLTAPFELQNSWGRRLADADALRFVGYTDTYRGYLVGPEAHARSTYEATSSYADAVESQRLMAQMMRIAAP